MRKFSGLLFFILPVFPLAAQKIDKVKFFEDDRIIKATLVTNLGKVMNGKMKDNDSIPASLTFCINDSCAAAEKIVLSPRGHYRRENCYVPPLKVDFKKNSASAYSTLGTLKLVNSCRLSNEYDQYILTEYLVYKIYNLLTDKSFRVRLMQITYKDTLGRKKDITSHAFLIEDVKDMAKRNKMVEWKNVKIHTEQTNREQMTLVSIFEYMIGNTDWSVPANHNIKLIYDKNKEYDRPWGVPYDFDYCGLVNAVYAVPPEIFNIENVRQRLYLGYPRNTDELMAVINIFNDKKSQVYDLINQFELLSAAKKKDMINYLEDFYKTINDPDKVQSVFIKNTLSN